MKKFSLFLAIPITIGMASCNKGNKTINAGSDSTVVDSKSVVADSTAKDSTVTK